MARHLVCAVIGSRGETRCPQSFRAGRTFLGRHRGPNYWVSVSLTTSSGCRAVSTMAHEGDVGFWVLGAAGGDIQRCVQRNVAVGAVVGSRRRNLTSRPTVGVDDGACRHHPAHAPRRGSPAARPSAIIAPAAAGGVQYHNFATHQHAGEAAGNSWDPAFAMGYVRRKSAMGDHFEAGLQVILHSQGNTVSTFHPSRSA